MRTASVIQSSIAPSVHYHALDGIRGMAIALVVLSHAAVALSTRTIAPETPPAILASERSASIDKN
jgi:peptidoglycan/LPS O-acetylase OafA/YrhL